jgi:hypothetical protein
MKYLLENKYQASAFYHIDTYKIIAHLYSAHVNEGLKLFTYYRGEWHVGICDIAV